MGGDIFPLPLVLIENNKISIGDLFDMKKKIGNGFDGDNSDTSSGPRVSCYNIRGGQATVKFPTMMREREKHLLPSPLSFFHAEAFETLDVVPTGPYINCYTFCVVCNDYTDESLSL